MKAICLLVILAIPALARADVILDWNEVTLDTIQRTSTPPPVAAWALAMTHVAIYDAVNSIEPIHQSFRVYAPDSADTSREAAAAQAAFRVLLAALSVGAGSAASGPGKRVWRVSRRPWEDCRAPFGRCRGRPGHRLAERRRLAAVVAYTPGNTAGPMATDAARLSRRRCCRSWSSVTPFGISFGSQFRPPFPPELRQRRVCPRSQEVRLLARPTAPSRDRRSRPRSRTLLGRWRRAP